MRPKLHLVHATNLVLTDKPVVIVLRHVSGTQQGLAVVGIGVPAVEDALLEDVPLFIGEFGIPELVTEQQLQVWEVGSTEIRECAKEDNAASGN